MALRAFWQTFEDDALKEMLLRGLTYGQMADRLGATRCMIAGRIHRLKLKGPRSK